MKTLTNLHLKLYISNHTLCQDVLRHNIALQFLLRFHNKTTIYHHLLTLSGEKKILDLYISLNEERC